MNNQLGSNSNYKSFNILLLIPLFFTFYQISVIVITILRIYKSKKIKTKVKHSPRIGITIIKPLSSTDCQLEANLRSHFELKYPKFEMIFCIDEPKNKVVDLVERLIKEYKRVDSKIVYDNKPMKENCVNPLVNNLKLGYKLAKYPYIWVSTSRVKTSSNCIENMARIIASSSDVGLVHQVPIINENPKSGHPIERICFGGSLARNYIGLNTIGICCFTGMSYIFRKSCLDKLGGIEIYGKYIAEDFFIGKDIKNSGYKVILADYPVKQSVEYSSLKSYKDRFVRWLRIRINIVPFVALVLEPIQETFTLAFLTSLSLNALFSFNFLFVFLAYSTFILITDYLILNIIQDQKPMLNFGEYTKYWIIKEIMVYQIFFEALCEPQIIRWQEKSFKINFGGISNPIPN